jgi:hypothetical protein
MRKSIIAIAAGLMALSAVSAQAAALDQNRPAPDRQEQHQNDNHQNDNRANNAQGGQHRDSYGSWSSSWGSRPPAPPAHFKRQSNWYAHVRACQQRYRTYNPRTDRYTVRAGRTAICSL